MEAHWNPDPKAAGSSPVGRVGFAFLSLRFQMAARQLSQVNDLLSKNVQFQYQNAVLGAIVSRLTGTSVRYRPVAVASPLSSASLFCSVIKNTAIRNDSFSNGHFKKLEGMLHPKNKIWNATNWAEPRKRSVSSTIDAVMMRSRIDSVKTRFLEHCEDAFRGSSAVDGHPLRKMLGHSRSHSQAQKATTVSLLHISKAMQFGTDLVCSSLFPVNSTNFDLQANSSSPNEAVQRSMAQVSHVNGGICGSGRALLGMSIRIKGIRKGGEMSSEFRKSVGKTSTSAIFGRSGKGGVVYEKSYAQVKTLQGAVGLKVTIAYSKQEDLVSESTKKDCALCRPTDLQDENTHLFRFPDDCKHIQSPYLKTESELCSIFREHVNLA